MEKKSVISNERAGFIIPLPKVNANIFLRKRSEKNGYASVNNSFSAKIHRFNFKFSPNKTKI